MGASRFAAVLFAVWGFAAGPAVAEDDDTITQYSTLEALVAGLYDGDITVDAMAAYGDLGIGTYDALDGELIEIDGKFWRARHDGSVEVVAPDTEIPFAAVTFFDADATVDLEPGWDMAALGAVLDKQAPNGNLPVAVRIEGTFDSLTWRAPNRQDEPYPPLGEALKDQAVWTADHVEATLVGFRYPAWLGNLNVPGWHFHFVSADGTRGGHVLDLMTGTGEAGLDMSSGVEVLLPQSEGFAGLELKTP
jgi:acetolactate decarboxylase